MADPVETSELLAFAKTVEARSISQAATELGVPRATIGRRLARLEERLGVRLLKRTTRTLVVTEAGEALYRHARIVLDAVALAEASVRRSDGAVRGNLRVSVPPMGDESFLRELCRFAAESPEVRLHVHFSAEHVDLRAAGVDVALRASTALEPGLVARTLAKTPLVFVAAPAYLAARGTPRTASELRRHRCLVGFDRGLMPQTHWPLKNGKKIAIEGALFSNEIRLLCVAAEDGLGIAYLPLMLVKHAIDEGKLVRVLPNVEGVESRIAIVYAEREFLPAPIRAFVDSMVAWAPKGLQAAAVEKKCVAERGGRRRGG